jgi:hypothetical protein
MQFHISARQQLEVIDTLCGMKNSILIPSVCAAAAHYTLQSAREK